MSNIIGVRNNSTIVPYVGATKRTKQLTLVKTTDITVATSGATLGTYLITRAVAIFYADSAGIWRMIYNLRLSCDAGTRADITVTFPNVVFKNTAAFKQACSVGVSATVEITGAAYTYPAGSSNTVIVEHAGGSTTGYQISGDVELNSEPTTYTTAANMEGVVAADVYIAPASASVDGLVNRSAQTFAGVKTFNGGLINGAAASWIELGANSGHGSTNTKIRKLSVLRSSGTAVTHTGSSTDGSTLTINETGLYHISYTDAYGSAATAFGISRNSNQLTTTILSITESAILMYTEAPSDIDTNVSVLAYLSANDVLRAHTDGNPNRAASPRCKVFITQVLRMS